LEKFNEADEVWTPSPLIAKWYADAGVDRTIHVYEHGVDHSWKNTRRRREGEILKFLHHGEPAPRKGGQMAFDAFREAFGDQKDVHLTIKSFGESTVRHKDKRGNILGPANSVSNVTVMERSLQEEELKSLYQQHHVMVYPGYGEGFGLIPLQAMATGMPTICTGAWAPYERLLLPELRLGARLIDSPWEYMHPGKVYEPSFDDLVESYRFAYENYNLVAGRAYANGFKVHKEYDWDALTEKAFSHVVEKFS
jgi:glycosyltransferase involved in cell wall biosynthesis